jgi:hexulose-6-phosphate isomerase
MPTPAPLNGRREFLRGGLSLTGGLLAAAVWRAPAAAQPGASPAASPHKHRAGAPHQGAPRTSPDGASASGPLVPPLSERRRPIAYALKWGMVGTGGSVLERFRLLKDLGYDGVELDSPSDLDLGAVLEAKAATGLATDGLVGSQHWSKPLSHPDPAVRDEGRRALEQGLRDAARLSASSLLVVPAVVGSGISYRDAWERSSAEIRRLLPLASELGVQILFENVWNHFLLSPLEAARYVDQFESPAVGWHFDVGNVVNTGWPEHWIEVLGARIKKLDVKEYSRQKRDDLGLWKGFDVEIGEGDCGWPAVGQALDALGYRGFAAAEVPGGDRARLATILTRMHTALQA